MCYVTPTEDMIIRPGQHVAGDGRIYHPYLAHWKEHWEVSPMGREPRHYDKIMTWINYAEIKHTRLLVDPVRYIREGTTGHVALCAAAAKACSTYTTSSPTST